MGEGPSFERKARTTEKIGKSCERSLPCELFSLSLLLSHIIFQSKRKYYLMQRRRRGSWIDTLTNFMSSIFTFLLCHSPLNTRYIPYLEKYVFSFLLHIPTKKNKYPKNKKEEHHYVDTSSGYHPLESIQSRDAAKKEAAMARGITLIPIPFWWDGYRERYLSHIEFWIC